MRQKQGQTVTGLSSGYSGRGAGGKHEQMRRRGAAQVVRMSDNDARSGAACKESSYFAIIMTLYCRYRSLLSSEK